VDTVEAHGKPVLISSKILLAKIRSSVTAIGKYVLRFKAEDLGLHSLRSGVVMATYLNNMLVYTITLLGIWSSGAFFDDTPITK
jgi:hypothetical protein